jgi:hypothetical protein
VIEQQEVIWSNHVEFFGRETSFFVPIPHLELRWIRDGQELLRCEYLPKYARDHGCRTYRTGRGALGARFRSCSSRMQRSRSAC